MINLIVFVLLFLPSGFTGLDRWLTPFLPEKQAYPEPFCGRRQLLLASINHGFFPLFRYIAVPQHYGCGSEWEAGVN